MGKPRAKIAQMAGVTGTYSDEEDIDVSVEDFHRPGGFILVAGTGGNVVVNLAGSPDTDRTFTLEDGGYLHRAGIRATVIRVKSAGTTASGLVAVYL